MKKMLIVMLVALCAVYSVNAVGAEFGIKAGVTMGNVVWGEDNEISDFDQDSFRAGLTGGLMMEIPFGPISIGAELLYTQKGEKFDLFSESLTHAAPVVTAKLDYIEVPVMAKLGLLPILKVYGGVSYGFLAKEEMYVEYNGESESVTVKEFTGLDPATTEFGAIVGAQLKLSKLVFDVRYSHGLTDILQDNPGKAAYLRTLSGTIGITF